MSDAPKLNECGCCEPEPSLDPIANRPGLTSLSYRLGVYGSFFRRLLDNIHAVAIADGPNEGAHPLAALTTRSSDDASIALLDAWAVVADVLTFYQERIANEGFLRTATERRSILELAREIGYELGPGVAANVFLQFTVEEIIGVAPPGAAGPGNSPFNLGRVEVPRGTQVQSVPAPNQLPQTFETSTDFEARVEWNRMRPRVERPADLALSSGKLYLLGTSTSFRAGTFVNLPVTKVYLLNPATVLDPSIAQIAAVEIHQIYLQGTSTNLKKSERMLLVGYRNGVPSTKDFLISHVDVDSEMNRTCIRFANSDTVPSFEPKPLPAAALGSNKVAFTQNNVKAVLLDKTVSESDLDAFLQFNGWNAMDLETLVNHPPPPPTGQFGALALRSTSGFYGHNAQQWKSLPNPSTAQRDDPYPQSWDTPNKGKGRLVWTDSQGNPYTDADVYLERSFPQILPASWVLFDSPTAGSATYQVSDVLEKSLADYGLSGRSTGLKLQLQAKVKGIGLGAPAIVSATASTVDMFAIGVDGNLYHRWMDSQNAWHGPDKLGGGNLAHSPSAVSSGPNRIDVFAIGTDGNLYQWWSDGNNSWQGPENRGGGNLAGSPSAVSQDAKLLDVFAVGSDGALYHSSAVNNQQWQGPVSWGGSNLVNSPSAISIAPGFLDVFAIGDEGFLYRATSEVIFQNLTIQIPPVMVAFGSFVHSPSAVWQPLLGGYYVGVNNSQGELVLLGGIPFISQLIGLMLPVGIVDGRFTGSPSVRLNGPVGIEIFATGDDGNLHYGTWDVQVNFWLIQQISTKTLGGDGNLMDSPAAILRQSNRIDVAAVGSGGHWFYASFDGNSWQAMKDLGNGNMVPFLVRNTTAYVQSEPLPLAGLPIRDDLRAGIKEITLDGMVIGLKSGQPVALSGIRADASAVAANEILVIDDITHAGGFTTITFEKPLQHRYVRSSVMINANVTTATHGATVQEILGSGDGSQTNQSFTLKRPPLTYVANPELGGIGGTLEVRVNDLAWQESPSFYGLNARDETYVLRRADDGTPTLTFGEPAARLKTGQQNVRATYRTGIGHLGNVGAGSLSMLMSRPPGLRGVTNPLAADGGADPQRISQARKNAPLTVLTLERIVSLEDYESFASAYPGVGKAQAVALWSGEIRLAHLTVAASNGGSVSKGGSLYKNLMDSILQIHDPTQRFMLAGYQKLPFNLYVQVMVDEPRYDRDRVWAAVRRRLASVFFFDQRAFAQAVTAAEIITLIQTVPGVTAVNLKKLYMTSDPQGPAQKEPAPFLAAAPARWEKGAISPAQLLLLNSKGLQIEEMPA